MGRHTRLIANPSLPCCCERFLPTEAPSLHRHYPVSAVLWTSPRPQTAQPASHEVPVDPVPAITAGASRVAPDLLCLHAVAITRLDPENLFARAVLPTPTFPDQLEGQLLRQIVSRHGRRSLTLQLTDSRSRYCNPFHRRLQRFRYLHRRSDCYRVERTSSRAGLSPAEDQRLSRRTNCALLSLC